MLGIYLALYQTDKYEPLVLYTDSQNALREIRSNGISKHKYQRQLVSLIQDSIGKRREPTSLLKVKAHSGVYGNEQADRLAKLGTDIVPERSNLVCGLELGTTVVEIHCKNEILK
jgi:ribonuclease HI